MGGYLPYRFGVDHVLVIGWAETCSRYEALETRRCPLVPDLPKSKSSLRTTAQ